MGLREKMKDGIDEEDGLAVFVVGQPVFLGAGD